MELKVKRIASSLGLGLLEEELVIFPVVFLLEAQVSAWRLLGFFALVLTCFGGGKS